LALDLRIDRYKPFEVETDGTDNAIGAILYKNGKLITFESKKLDLTQRRYSVHENELFAVIYARRTWRHYLYRNRFVVTTDHQSLNYFYDQQDVTNCKARWADLIQEFDFSICYHKGSLNTIAYALSRLHEVNMLSLTQKRLDEDTMLSSYPMLLGLGLDHIMVSSLNKSYAGVYVT
jgi:hypothetical protein